VSFVFGTTREEREKTKEQTKERKEKNTEGRMNKQNKNKHRIRKAGRVPM
jgi:hypothetical protein